jgi:Fe-Mn family superoxide dismutase
LENLPEDIYKTIREQGGGHANHELFWQILKPGPGSEPKGALLEAINKDFKSFDEMKMLFDAEVTKLFGSGWVFLALQKGQLMIQPTHNHDSVITFGMSPLMICDVWEHAYYLKHQNRRPDYLGSFWNLVDWDVVQKRFDFFHRSDESTMYAPYPL